MPYVDRLPGVNRGFNLIELAIVLVIIGLLAGGGLMVMAKKNEIERYRDTQNKLELAIEALAGFAQRHGRLPCPATASSNGQESPMGGGACTSAADTDAYYGFLPASTLGIATGGGCAGVTGSGYLQDAWGGCIRYAVSRANSNAATTTDGIKSVFPNYTPNLRVCEQAACSIELVGDAAALVFSAGRNGALPPAGTDEQENLDNDRTFVKHEPRLAGAPGGEYDDVVSWLATTILVNRLTAAGRLP